MWNAIIKDGRSTELPNEIKCFTGASGWTPCSCMPHNTQDPLLCRILIYGGLVARFQRMAGSTILPLSCFTGMNITHLFMWKELITELAPAGNAHSIYWSGRWYGHLYPQLAHQNCILDCSLFTFFPTELNCCMYFSLRALCMHFILALPLPSMPQLTKVSCYVWIGKLCFPRPKQYPDILNYSGFPIQTQQETKAMHLTV